MAFIAKLVLWIIALFYAYGAIVHIMNIASLTGFEWREAPVKWQVLDVLYLVLDVVVAVGLLARWWVGYVAFYIAAISQIVLYTFMRSWIIDVPDVFAVSSDQLAYLDTLVVFHIASIILVSFALWSIRRKTFSAVNTGGRS